MRDLRDKRAFLTGAASGIGRALSIELARAGTHLFLVDVDQGGLRDVARQAAKLGVDVQDEVCDLTDRRQISAAIDRARTRGPIDLLVNNAGIAFYGPTETMSAQQWDLLLSVNLLAPVHITRELLPQLLDRPDAHIVNMCSISGLVAGGRFAAYHVSKFGLVGFTEALRAEYGRRGLGVTAVCPGPSRTNLYSSALSGRPDRQVPAPPAWLCASPELIARRTVRAIRRNHRMLLITPLAHGLYNLKRFAPGLIDFVNTLSRKRFRRKRETRVPPSASRRAA